MYGADEAFVTGTFAGLIPVVEVDGRCIGEARARQKALELGLCWCLALQSTVRSIRRLPWGHVRLPFPQKLARHVLLAALDLCAVSLATSLGFSGSGARGPLVQRLQKMYATYVDAFCAKGRR